MTGEWSLWLIREHLVMWHWWTDVTARHNKTVKPCHTDCHNVTHTCRKLWNKIFNQWESSLVQDDQWLFRKSSTQLLDPLQLHNVSSPVSSNQRSRGGNRIFRKFFWGIWVFLNQILFPQGFIKGENFVYLLN